MKKLRKIILVILSIIVGSVLLSFVILFIASGLFTTPKYLQPWEKTYYSTHDDPRIQLASHGLLAANSHNIQPWKIKLDAENNMVFYLYTDSDRLTLEVDPLARQILISQGTFLEYVKVAGEQLGYDAEIALFPDGIYDESNLKISMDTKPVAKITLTKVAPTASALYNCLFLPDTNRAAYQTTQLTSEQITQLQNINSDADLTVEIFQDENNLLKLGKFAMAGAQIESGVHRINMESADIFRSNEYQKNEFRYGFSVEGQGTTGMTKHILQGMLTLVPFINDEQASAQLYVNSTQVAVNNTPAYAMITTKDNSRINQVKAGMLYSKLILTAHSLGFVMQPPSQVLEEYPEMSQQYADIHKEYALSGGTIQMFFRMGKPTVEFPQSMRRDVMDLIK